MSTNHNPVAINPVTGQPMYGKAGPSQTDLKDAIKRAIRETEEKRKRDAWWSIQIAADYL